MIDKHYFFDRIAPNSSGLSKSLPFESFIRPAKGLTLEFHQYVEDHLHALGAGGRAGDEIETTGCHMRSVRLDMARQAMIRKPGGKIQGAALDAGFGHVARFSKYYFDFYGELPSATAARFNGDARHCPPDTTRAAITAAHGDAQFATARAR